MALEYVLLTNKTVAPEFSLDDDTAELLVRAARDNDIEVLRKFAVVAIVPMPKTPTDTKVLLIQNLTPKQALLSAQ